MLCDFGENSHKRLEAPVEVQCRRCGSKYLVRLLPLRVECGMSDVIDFLDNITPRSTGLGDIVAKAIDTVTLGLLKKTEGCGCQERQDWLNKLWSWKPRQ